MDELSDDEVFGAAEPVNLRQRLDAARTHIRSLLPPTQPPWYNPQPREPGPRPIVTPDTRGDTGGEPDPMSASAQAPGELSDSEVFGTGIMSPSASQELSDADVFGPPSTSSRTRPFQQQLEIGKRVVGGAAETVASTIRGLGGLAAGGPANEGDALEQAIVMAQQGNDPAQVTEAMRGQQRQVGAATEQPVYQAGETYSAAANALLRPQPNVLPKFVEDVASGFGSVAANIATGLIPGTQGLLAVQGSGEAVERAVRAGATPEQQLQAAQLGGFAGATELVDSLLPALGSTGRVLGFLHKVGTKTVVGTLAEAGQEGVQQLIQNSIAHGLYNPAQDIWEDVPYNALIGGVVGAHVVGLSAAASRGGTTTPAPSVEDLRRAYEATTGGAPVFDPNAMPGETLRGWLGEALREPEPVQSAASTLESAQPSPLPVFYSNVLRVANERLPERGSPEQMLATLRNSPGVKEEEVEATGVAAYLASQRGQVSRGDVVAHLEENQVRVEEVLRQTPTLDARAMAGGTITPTAFPEWRTPGPSQNYRELLLTLPRETPRIQQTNVVTGETFEGSIDPTRSFTGSHWTEPNVLAHVRFTDRVDRSGMPVLHIEEIQSDWHQAGRRTGYDSDFVVSPRDDGQGGIFYVASLNGVTMGSGRTPADARADARGSSAGSVVPNAPFKTSWPELTFKRMLRWAADNGYSRISWNNGDLAARYAAGGVTDPRTKAGLVEFYDKIIPSIARRWAKKLGGVVGATDIAVGADPTLTPARAVGVNGWGVQADNGSRVYALQDPAGGTYFADTEAEARQWISQQDIGSRSAQHLDITPRAQSFIQQGLPLFTQLQQNAMRVQVDLSIVQKMARNDPFVLATERASAILDKLARRFKLETKVRLVIKEDSGRQVLAAGGGEVATHGAAEAHRFADGTYAIIMHAGQFNNPASITQYYVSLMHEFGHVVFWEHFARLPESDQRAIRADFDRFYQGRRSDKTIGDLVKRRDNAVITLSGRRPMLRALNELAPEQREYWYHFEEWMAEQVARWATSDARPLAVAERIFKGLGKKLIEIFHAASAAFGVDFRAAESVRQWLDSFMTDAPPLAAKIYDDLDMRSQHAAQTQLDHSEPELQAVPRQTETDGIYRVLSMLSTQAPVGQQQALRPLGPFADKFNVFYKYMTHAFQLGVLNPNLVPLQSYLEKIRAAGVEESKIVDATVRVMKAWDALPGTQGENLTGLLDDVTNMNYRSPAEVARGIARQPTPAEFNTSVATHGVSAEGVSVFQKIKGMFDTFLDLSSQLAMVEALKITDPIARADAVTAIRANVLALKSRPYFPFMRFGRHVVVVRNAAGVVVHREHFERIGLSSAESQQKKAMARLQTIFPGHTVTPDILSESAEPMIGMPTMMLDMIANKLTLSALQRDALEQLRFEMAPAQSYRHRFQHKHYIRGYSRDFQRAFAQYFFSGAKWYVKVKYADGLRADQKATHDDLSTSTTPTKRLKIARFMADHLENQFLNPKQDFLTFKAAMVFMTLAFVPVSALVNMSQVPLGTLPFLAGKFGLPGLADTRAATAITKAIANWRNYYKKGSYETLTDADSKAINYAIKTGRLQQTLAGELASWSQHSNLGVGYGGSLPARILHEGLQKGMWMFEMAEKWNRRVTFMATLDLARKHPNMKYVRETLTHYQAELATMVASGFSQAEAEAIVVANHTVDQTQFMGTQESRPRFMRGKLGSLFLYKRFIQGLLFMNLTNKADVLPRFALIMLAVGGFHGIPGYDDMEEIARVLGWWLFSKDFKLSREIRSLVSQLTDNRSAADQILHGTSRMGFGMPWLLNMMGNQVGLPKMVPSIDFSRSIGPGTVLPLELSKLFGPPINDPNKMFGEQSARASGVMGTLALNMYKAVASREEPGDFKRWESAMPRFARNLSHSYRAFSEERERGRSDSTVIRYDWNDPEQRGEILGLAVGMQPRRLTAKWEELRDQGEVIKFFDVQRSMLLEQWTKAVRDNNPKELDRMRAATLRFNDDLPHWARGKAIGRDTLERSVRGRIRTQELQEGGLSSQRTNIPIVEEMQRLHPEAAPFDIRRVR